MSERWRVWSERQAKSGHGGLPNLKFGGTLVAILVSSFFAAKFADTLFVMLAFGPHAYFVDGLRVSDWKQGVLSTGAELHLASNLARGLSRPFRPLDFGARFPSPMGWAEGWRPVGPGALVGGSLYGLRW
jgi:hypothetical protein